MFRKPYVQTILAREIGTRGLLVDDVPQACHHLILSFLKHPDSTRFDDPKFSGQFLAFQARCQCADGVEQIFVAGFARQLQYGNARVTAGAEIQRVGKVEVERNNGSTFPPATFNEFFVLRFFESLTGYGGDIVTGIGKNLSAPLAEIFVELELHACASSGTST